MPRGIQGIDPMPDAEPLVQPAPLACLVPMKAAERPARRHPCVHTWDDALAGAAHMYGALWWLISVICILVARPTECVSAAQGHYGKLDVIAEMHRERCSSVRGPLNYVLRAPSSHSCTVLNSHATLTPCGVNRHSLASTHRRTKC